MPKTIDVVAKDLYYAVEIKATEIKKLSIALSLCEGGVCKTEEEKEAWEYFVKEFYPYIDEVNKELENGS